MKPYLINATQAMIDDGIELLTSNPYRIRVVPWGDYRELEKQAATSERVLRASVPERYKGATSAVGGAQSYIAELERTIKRLEEITEL